MLICFSATPTAKAFACNNDCCKKEIKNEVIKKEQKDCCKNTRYNNTQHKNKKQKKGNCNGDCNDCNCCVSSYSEIYPTVFHLVSVKLNTPEKQITPYTQFPPKSVFIEFWQPPKV